MRVRFKTQRFFVVGQNTPQGAANLIHFGPRETTTMLTVHRLSVALGSLRSVPLALFAAASMLLCTSASRAQVTPYTGQMITAPTGTLTFNWNGGASLASYTEAGLSVTCPGGNSGQGCTKCCRPSGFSVGGYYMSIGVQALVRIARVDGGALSALEFQAGDYYNGCAYPGGDGTIYIWALVYSGGNVESFDINAPSGTVVGFSGVFDVVEVAAYVSGAVRDLHDATQPQAIALDNMRYVDSSCPGFAAPASIFACADGANTFSVAPVGAGPISYQWQWQQAGADSWLDVSEGVNSEAAPYSFTASGSQASTLTRTGTLAPGSVVLYRCIVSNACSSITGAPATLAITPAPTITQQPQDEPLCGAPGYALFSVQAVTTPADPGPFTYQWQKLSHGNTWTAVTDSEDVTGSTTAYLAINFDATDVAGQFRCVVTNSCTSTVSSPAVLSFGNLPVVGTQPVDSTICGSGTGTFDIESAGTQPVSYQWSVESPPGSNQYTPIPDNATFVDAATGLSFYAYGTQVDYMTISQVALGQHPSAIRFLGTLANACGSTNGNVATLTVCLADFDCSGAVTVQDIFSFLSAWFNRDPSADINGDGFVSVQDIFDFLTLWFAGCG